MSTQCRRVYGFADNYALRMRTRQTSLNMQTMFPHADLENWNGTDRFHFNAIVSDQDLVEVLSNILHAI